jgi:hypothetical protein
MGDGDGDWRLTNQEAYLKGATLVRKPYRAYSETWDHDHCVFCWATFIDPTGSDVSPKYVDEHPDVLTEGYATTADHPRGADYYWICSDCFDDFAQPLAGAPWMSKEPAEPSCVRSSY